MTKVRLGDVLEPRREVVHPRDNPIGEALFVGLEHIESNTGRRIGGLEVRLQDLTGRKPRFHAGDIVYGYLRPYLNKVWVADRSGLCSVDQYVFEVRDAADPQFVAAYLRSPMFLARAPVDETPGQLPRIRLDEVLAVTIDLPALPEQHRLAVRLAAKLAEAAAARSSAEAARRSVWGLRNAIVDEALSSVAEAPRVALVGLGSLADGDWILNADYAPTGVRLLQVGDVGSGVLRLKSDRFIAAERATELGCTLLQPGDLLISRMAEPIGRTCILPDLGYPAITAVDVTIFRPRENVVDREFLNIVMNSRQWLRSVEARASGATRPRISRTNLESLTVPVPPLQEQRQLVMQLSRRIRAIDTAGSALAMQFREINTLTAALLREAFGTDPAEVSPPD